MKYAAFIRGIGPGNPNMTNDKLRAAFEELGYREVHSVISSGNIIFTAPGGSQRKLGAEIEVALNAKLGIPGKTIVRNEKEMKAFVEGAPFGRRSHSRTSYLLVTLLKQPLKKIEISFPFEHDGFKVLAFDKNFQAVVSVSDATRIKTPDYMSWAERQFGKDITSRTWNTIQKIQMKM